jgi:hypothetical protein
VAAVYTIIFHFKNILPQILFVCLKWLTGQTMTTYFNSND